MKSTANDMLGFSFRKTKDESVAISRGHRVVTILRGLAARQFLAKASAASDAGQQQLMARVTGNYKRGNERLAGTASQGRGATDV